MGSLWERTCKLYHHKFKINFFFNSGMNYFSIGTTSLFSTQKLNSGSRRNFAASAELKRTVSTINSCIYLYVLLLIFEGALRKWFLPGLAAPLLIIRDPLAFYIIFLCWKQKILPSNLFLAGTVWIGFISLFSALFLGHGNIFVALFGSRYLLLHFPLIFIIGQTLDRPGIIQIGKQILIIAIPVTILTVLQFYSPQSAWVNRGVGGDMEGAGFNGGALGYFRPPGPFSFTNGNTMFFSLVAAFVFFFWLNSKHVNKLLLIAATLCLIIEIPISISRSLFFQIIVSMLFAIVAMVRNPRQISKLIFILAVGFVAIGFLQQIEFFKTATEAFMQRFENASNDEGGLKGTLVDRFLMSMFGSVSESSGTPLFGYGLGLGTNVGSQLTTGDRQFLIAEDEWPRLIGEIGPLFGLLIILIRTSLAVKLLISAYRSMKGGEFLPWLLMSYGFLLILQGGWAQPTSLGFCTVVAGLSIAAFRNGDSDETSVTGNNETNPK
jgi:diacylglycerol kinase